MNDRTKAYVIGGLVAIAIGVTVALSISDLVSGGGEATQLCMDTFGNGTEYIGWVESKPPHLVCKLENGTIKLVETTEQLVE